MDRDDEMIRGFFLEMKKADSDFEVPEFHSPHPRGKMKSNFLAIAASLLLLAITAWYLLAKTEEPPTVEIVIIEKNTNGSMSLMDSDESIENWNSPTQSLINDF